jgi:hypothetical protein
MSESETKSRVDKLTERLLDDRTKAASRVIAGPPPGHMPKKQPLPLEIFLSGRLSCGVGRPRRLNTGHIIRPPTEAASNFR